MPARTLQALSPTWAVTFGVVAASVIGATIGLSRTFLIPSLVGAALLLLIVTFGPSRRAGTRADSASSEGIFHRPARLALYAGLFFASATVIRPAAGLTASDLFLGAAGLLVALDALIRGHVSRDASTPWMAIGAALLCLGGLASSLNSPDPTGSLLVVIRIVAVVLAFPWVARTLLDDSVRLLRGLSVWCLGVAVSGYAAAITALTGVALLGARGEAGRFSGLSAHVNELGATTALALVPSIYLVADSSQSPTNRFVRLVTVGGVALGLALSGSVNGLVTAVAAVAVWSTLAQISIRRLIRLTAIAVMTVALVVVLVPAGSNTPWSRIVVSGSSIDTKSDTFGSRKATFSEARAKVSEDPWTGIGFVDSQTASGHEVHNLLLQTWYEGGLFAMLGMAIILLGFGIRAYILVVKSKHGAVDRQLASSIAASFVAFVVYGMAAILLYKRLAWVVPALLSAAYGIQIRSTASRQLHRSQHEI